jgi:hypothetical protein
MGQYFPAFKAYDVRGRYPEELNAELCRAIGRAYADETGAKTVCLGRDIRLSGPELLDALAEGLMEAGVDVIDLGLAGTEMVYFATAFYGIIDLKELTLQYSCAGHPGPVIAGHDYGNPRFGVTRAVDEAFPEGVAVHGTVWAWGARR